MAIVRKPAEWRKYVLTLIFTLLIFGALIYVNYYLEQKRVENVQSIQDQISLDLLSSETQFTLLSDTSCKNVNDSVLATELDSLSGKLSYMESNDSGGPNDELTYLKKYYSLLEIKDFLLSQEISQKCPSTDNPIPILYFYSDAASCADCGNMANVLTYLRGQYPDVRIYSFDYELDLSAIDTLKSIYNITGSKLPAIVVNDDTYYGFQSVDDMKKIIPYLKVLDAEQAASSTSATSSAASSSSSSSSGDGQ